MSPPDDLGPRIAPALDLPGRALAVRPDDETIWAAARGEASPEQLQAVLDAALQDPEVAMAFRLASALQDEPFEAAPEPGPGQETDAEAPVAEAPAANNNRSWAVWLIPAAAAAVVVIVAVGSWSQVGLVGDSGVYRGGEGVEVAHDPLRLPSDRQIRFEAPPGTQRFDVIVYKANLSVGFEARGLDKPEVTIPALGEGPWEVKIEAIHPEGKRTVVRISPLLEPAPP